MFTDGHDVMSCKIVELGIATDYVIARVSRSSPR
jgi:hypothetical protein